MTLLCHHSLRNLLNYGKYTLTMPRLRHYHRLLEQEDAAFIRCTTANPAENVPTLEDYVEEEEEYSKHSSDFHALPLHNSEVEYCTDGSCYWIGKRLSVMQLWSLKVLILSL